MQNLKFNKAQIEQMEHDFSKVQPTPEMKKILIGVATILAKYLPIKEFSLRGFVLFSIQDTQKELKLLVKDIATMPPDKKSIFIKKTFENIEERLKRVLMTKSAEDLEVLHNAIIEAYKFRMSQKI